MITSMLVWDYPAFPRILTKKKKKKQSISIRNTSICDKKRKSADTNSCEKAVHQRTQRNLAGFRRDCRATWGVEGDQASAPYRSPWLHGLSPQLLLTHLLPLQASKKCYKLSGLAGKWTRQVGEVGRGPLHCRQVWMRGPGPSDSSWRLYLRMMSSTTICTVA